MASGAKSIIESCMIVDTLDEALVGVNFVVGSSARSRRTSVPMESLREVVPKIAEHVELESKCALVFGRERTGLYNNELLKCHLHAYIPANQEYSSLNLSQAVQVFSYELRMHFLQDDIVSHRESLSIASSDKCLALYEHFEEMLYAVSFIKEGSPGLVMDRIKRLFQRAQLEDVEVNILRGICKEIMRHKKL
jgi:tRNA (cytidine32/uridine32-2'-O)-methyltransferase